jgi:hypothetical protein
MAAQSNLTLADGQASPVNHTFYVGGSGWNQSLGGILSRWNDRSQAAPIGYWKVSMAFKSPEGQRKNYQVTMKSETPVLENVTNSTVSGIAPAPTISYMPSTQTVFTIPGRSSVEARKDQLAIHKNILANAITTSAVVDLESVS